MTHFLQRSALILLGTTALAACTATGEQIRPTYPSRSSEAPAAPLAPVVAPPPPAAEATPAPQIQAPPAAVESQALPPLVTAPRVPEPAPAAPPQPPAPPVSLRPEQSPPLVFEIVTRKTVTGKVVTIPGRPVTYTVRKGDTLEKIAKKLDTSIEALRSDNKLKKKHLLQPGDTLKGPATDAKAYVVGAGDTFFSIGRRFGVSVDALREENDLSSRASIHSGQRLRLPGGYRDHGPVTLTERVATGGGATTAEPQADVTPPPPVRNSRGSRTPPPPVETQLQTVTRRTVTGRVVEIEGRAAVYKVRKGDNLSKVARKLDTSVDDLRTDNHLKSSDIHPGQTLKGPRSTAKAYVAGAGDTLADIARRFGVRPEALRAENGLSRRASIRPGQKVRLPDGYRDRGPLVTRVSEPAYEAPAPVRDEERPTLTPRPPLPSATLPSAPQPYTPPPGGTRPYVPAPPSGGLPPQAPTQSAPLSDAQISQIGRGRFIWPLQGDVLSPFGPKAGGQKNDGINIQATSGDSVRAAASGSVVYAGDQVPGFGNLVLLQHPDGWVTAYGHLSHIDVKNRQQIAQGQQIGLAGATGGVPEPQLHFEVRYAQSPKDRAQPIDPRLVLPR